MKKMKILVTLLMGFSISGQLLFGMEEDDLAKKISCLEKELKNNGVLIDNDEKKFIDDLAKMPFDAQKIMTAQLNNWKMNRSTFQEFLNVEVDHCFENILRTDKDKYDDYLYSLINLGLGQKVTLNFSFIEEDERGERCLASDELKKIDESLERIYPQFFKICHEYHATNSENKSKTLEKMFDGMGIKRNLRVNMYIIQLAKTPFGPNQIMSALLRNWHKTSCDSFQDFFYSEALFAKSIRFENGYNDYLEKIIKLGNGELVTLDFSFLTDEKGDYQIRPEKIKEIEDEITNQKMVDETKSSLWRTCAVFCAASSIGVLTSVFVYGGWRLMKKYHQKKI
jgi:hypothetical protein